LKFISTQWHEFCESSNNLIFSKSTNQLRIEDRSLDPNEQLPLELICDCILRTLYAVIKLKEKNIFPYNIEPLINRMTEIETLYESKGNENQIIDSSEDGEWSGSDYENENEGNDDDQFDSQFIGKFNENLRSNLKENVFVEDDHSEIILHIAGWHL